MLEIMIDKTTHDDYIKLCKELVNRIEHKENMIEAMTSYIIKYSKKINPICYKSGICKCKNKRHKRCAKCIREFFEERRWMEEIKDE